MTEKKRMTFEEIFEQNERRIYYHMHKLQVRDPEQEFYQEGLIAMWNAYEKYEPDRGPMATYFNYTIRNRMIDLIRKKERDREGFHQFAEEMMVKEGDGNYYKTGSKSYPIVQGSEQHTYDGAFWGEIRSALSDNQWKWVRLFVMEGMPIKEIAEEEGVSPDAVKSWGREARKKLKKKSDDLTDYKY
ncbi:sigma-70 family RNA polymerase sigma factor [Virgibacillus oceani]